ncbi:hypothetical protein QIP17_gp3 [ssRNA phage Esthiorhiza.2_8]|uniref:Uncharacterized protein n=2 Tax=Leviviricetes TaxID=2842243 RepID=A0A8S5L2E0_9VIRU|nr:hypothetical protein QIP17_gp3 [ssRNA phage Esthiorhiza.2_8]QDH90182.1 MAG: hypothetical protein H2RhizoLitter491120_000003 [Leviviridae sp.]DAD51659.1 TPA_asm: hypothetical protein [ssRNA phage Esthiorhiza.2_8]
MPDDERDAHKGVSPLHRRLGRRHTVYGRRTTDVPQVTLGKKLLVILLAVVNVAYLAGDVILSTLNNCGH